MKIFDTESFIKKYVIEREESLLKNDLEKNAAQLKKNIDGKSVLVIGGAGTIGSSFIKALLKFKPKKLFVVDINENGLTELTRDLRSSKGYNIPADFKTYPLNFGDIIFEKIFENEGPFEIVANFAAHKHVRSEKDQYSIEAMIENNVLNAKKLLDQLIKHPPEHFFCVSTDKAANPVSVMGATKKLMEEVILAYSEKIPITTARFANVAFSNGSLLYGFNERISKRQPLSVPTDIERYFVSPEESGQLCLLACIIGKSGDIFFPKLDTFQMKSFSSITFDYLKEHEFETDSCSTEEEAKQKASLLMENSDAYPVYFFKTDTSGEKAYEEFYTKDEEIDMKRFRKLGVIKNAQKKSIDLIDDVFEALNRLFQQEGIDKKAIVELLKEVLPGFNHIELGKSLDQKM